VVAAAALAVIVSLASEATAAGLVAAPPIPKVAIESVRAPRPDIGVRPSIGIPRIPLWHGPRVAPPAVVVQDDPPPPREPRHPRVTSADLSLPGRRGFDLPPPGERRFVPDQVVITVAPGVPARALDDIARRHRLTRVDQRNIRLTGRSVELLRIPDGRAVRSVIQSLAGDRRIASAQPNYLFALQQATADAPAPNILINSGDEGAPAQYAVAKLRLPEAHRLATGDQVLVAVIDSAIDTAHPDLAGDIAGSFDALRTPAQPHPHGTAMAGAIAAHRKLVGVAPRVRLLAVRAFDGSGRAADGTTVHILEGLDWSAGQGARVINMSFAGPPDPLLAEALTKARARGIVLIAAAGNAGPRAAPQFPAADPQVIAVTATDADDRLFAKASRGGHVAIASPGVDILAPAPEAGYQITSGTSVAAAHVSGVAALMLERRPSLTPEELRRILTATARRLAPADKGAGAGLADALAAVSALAGSAPPVPVPVPVPVRSARP
jgi:subtilisin family serine protease